MRQTVIRDDIGVRAFDVFCPASFATALPWIASLELLLDAGIETIATWDQQLADHLVAGLDGERIWLISPADGASRSTLVVLSRTDGTSRQCHQQLAAAGIDAAYREGNIRLPPHLFNTHADVDQALNVVNALSDSSS
jgi:cysteine desulfurase/selenocysteine lyase